MSTSLDAVKLETETSVTWFEDGFFYTVYTKSSEISRETLVKIFDFIQTHTPNKKICWLVDSTLVKPSKEARNYSLSKTPELVKALALITNSPVSKIAANIFITLRKPPYPVKCFTDQDEAKEWLKGFR